MKGLVTFLTMIYLLQLTNAKTVGNGQSSTLSHLCKGTGLKCVKCDQCYPGGLCVITRDNKQQCICNYGWTGPGAAYIAETGKESKNLIRADNCLKPCHYTSNYRSLSCVVESSTPSGCHPNCVDKTGRCMPDGRCRCCKGWSGPNATYNRTLDRYIADYCDEECPYLGYGIANPSCSKKLPDIPRCNPLCLRNDGVCLEDTGRCLCCLGWTGPRAEYGTGIHDGRIIADYCTIYCPYTETRRNDLCLNPDYVERLQYSGHFTS